MTEKKGKVVKRKRRDGIKRQREIMDIALNLFSEKGFNETSLDDILNEAKIAKGTFYLHFKGKNDILNKIMDSYLDKFLHYLSMLNIALPIPLFAIKQIYIKLADFIYKSEDLKKFSKLTLREFANFSNDQKKKLLTFFEKIDSLIVTYITKAQKIGKIRSDLSAEVMAMTTIGAGKELFFRWAILNQKLNAGDVAKQMFELTTTGMLTKERKN